MTVEVIQESKIICSICNKIIKHSDRKAGVCEVDCYHYEEFDEEATYDECEPVSTWILFHYNCFFKKKEEYENGKKKK